MKTKTMKRISAVLLGLFIVVQFPAQMAEGGLRTALIWGSLAILLVAGVLWQQAILKERRKAANDVYHSAVTPTEDEADENASDGAADIPGEDPRT